MGKGKVRAGWESLLDNPQPALDKTAEEKLRHPSCSESYHRFGEVK